MSSIQPILLLNFFLKQAKNKLDSEATLQKPQQPKGMAVFLSSERPFHFLQAVRCTKNIKPKKRKNLQVQILL